MIVDSYPMYSIPIYSCGCFNPYSLLSEGANNGSED